MSKVVDTRGRESEILNLVIETYIKESKPISSTHLCEKYNLPYSSATIRNVMETLEKKGFLSHIHTSSGRVPTTKGFKQYVECLKKEEMVKNYPIELELYSTISDSSQVINSALDVLALKSGYASFLAVSGEGHKLFFRGARFILEQPEFEDMRRLKSVFYALEVRLNQIQELMLNYFDEQVKILVGDEIGFDEISDCSLVVSGSGEKKVSYSLALLGPMRMDYVRAVSCLQSIKYQLETIIEDTL
jgi:transcriptional regulator of heat shock response